MALVHISEEEALRDFGAVLTRAKGGEDIMIDAPDVPLMISRRRGPRLRTGEEMLAILKSLPGERGYVDEDFARDVMDFRERHSKDYLRDPWA
jgi:hypothetical protein